MRFVQALDWMRVIVRRLLHELDENVF